jgi:DNA-directed RNA polymerase specialized sigma24 family protein
VIEDATKETLNHETADTEDDLDEFDEDFDDEEDDLKAITNLDQILDREGIDLNAEDPTLNILTMYGAGLSIIEISKVLKMGVGEVKYIIDSNTSN